MNKENSPAQQILENLQNDAGLYKLSLIDEFIFNESESHYLDLRKYYLAYRNPVLKKSNLKFDIDIDSLLKTFKEADLSLGGFIKKNRDHNLILNPSLLDSALRLLEIIEKLFSNTISDFKSVFLITGRINRPLDINGLSAETFAIFILEILSKGKSTSVTDPFYAQYWKYLDNPLNNSLISWPQNRYRISINLLQKPYTENIFDEQLLEWAIDNNIQCNAPENTGLLISELLLSDENRPLWDFEPPQPEKSLLFAGYHSDSIDNHTDQLNITPDVDALAALIAYEKLNPPLSIGLFGHWGSGKSFFMKLLSKKISEYEKEAAKASTPNGFCKEIVQIEFNAWHYSDANLWANFMVTIFEHLNEKIKPKERNEKAQLLEEFQWAKAEIARQNMLLDQLGKDIGYYEEKLKELKRENDEKAAKLATLRPSDIWNLVAKSDRTKIENDLAGLAKELGLEKVQLAANSLNEFINEINKTSGRFGYLTNRFVNSTWQQKLLWTFLVILLPLLVLLYLRFGNYTIECIRNFLIGLKGYITTLTTICLTILVWGTSKLRKLNKSLDSIEEARNKVDALIEEKRRELASEEIVLQLEIDNLKAEQQRIEQQKADAEQRKRELELAIDNFNPRKQLTDFINKRSQSSDYNQHLGLISLIRNDLQKLSDLLTQNLSYVADEKEKEKFTALPGIQRIVLYIDDLDRCPPDRVKQVLEAIHLLLSFKLFVVIVGVDARWVKYALLNENSKQLSDESEKESERATAFDYLEKIFQIPFTLKPLNDGSRKKLLESYLKKELENTVKAESKDAKTISSAPEITALPQQTNIEINDVPSPIPNSDEKADEIIISDKPDHTSLKLTEDTNTRAQAVVMRNQLEITDPEKEFIHSISNLIGNTPRTIKRFVNIYRLIRVHIDVPEYSITTHADHLAIMLLLAVVTGCNQVASTLFQMLASSPKETLSEFVSDAGYSNAVRENNALSGVLQQLGELEERIEMNTLRKYIPFISRFSFRTL